MKAAIAHSDGTTEGITSACHNLNWEQRPDSSCCPAELFLNRTPRFPGLPTIPHKLIDKSDVKQRREESRENQIKKINRGLRKPETFEINDTVYLRDKEGKWKIPARVINQRRHQGFSTPSYLLRNLKTDTLIIRNERDLRKFEGDIDSNTVPTESPTLDPDDAEECVYSITVGIMKQRKGQSADKAEKQSPARARERKSEDKREPTAEEPSVAGVSATAGSSKPKRSLCWSKTIEIIRLEEPHPLSSFSLHHHFASRPRIIRKKKDEPVVRDKEEIPDEDNEENKR